MVNTKLQTKSIKRLKKIIKMKQKTMTQIATGGQAGKKFLPKIEVAETRGAC